MKKIFFMSAFVALSTGVLASNSNEPKSKETRNNAVPGCWAYGVPKVKVGKSDDCPTVECLAPYDNCCIELTDGNFMVRTLGGETLIFHEIEILNPGDENGHGIVITGCIR